MMGDIYFRNHTYCCGACYIQSEAEYAGIELVHI